MVSAAYYNFQLEGIVLKRIFLTPHAPVTLTAVSTIPITPSRRRSYLFPTVNLRRRLISTGKSENMRQFRRISFKVPFQLSVLLIHQCRKVSVKFTVSCCSATSPVTVVNGNVERRPSDRTEVRLVLPSKGRMAADSLDLLKDCQLSVRQVNPRQYVAEIPQISNLEVWFQRPKDIVRKLVSGDLDLGIVGLDTVCEYGQGDEDLIIVHDALEYGDCRLSLAIPKYGIFENVNSMKKLAEMPQWTPERPLRVATGFTYMGPKFMKENGLKHVTFSTADGALEAAPVMGIADAIVDLVSSGTTLREQSEGNRRWSHRAKPGGSCRWQEVPNAAKRCT